jgi:hypothetical protein
VPEISRFFGIVVFMLYREHNPPHFHARYGGKEISVEIESGAVTGKMSNRALRMIEEWREAHQDELLDNWNSARERRTLTRIEPLE